ncbi:uncharacterized protein LOC117646272 [Thrips palmi]|uniref:Uncharacterized protein LOC117646272 n=1 Tax=Thrips palmi TaxID=161013 RepID=A0A6P8YSH1_THRPL|nr:uncharacterized protein LOC117646272 [Thrips palmi]
MIGLRELFAVLAVVLVARPALCAETSKVQHKVKCLEDAMIVEIVKQPEMLDIYLEGLRSFPDANCHPLVADGLAVLRLDLTEKFECGITKVTNQMTGRSSYSHRVVIEQSDPQRPKEVLNVKCVRGQTANLTDHAVFKRSVLPAGFQEPEDLEITTELTMRAPEPQLSVGVRQGGQPVTGELNVNPGTALNMDVYLDKASAPIYGLLVSYMQVTDTKNQEETIIFNGCSFDPHLFENFNTVDGDFLTAKFRAFKFPDSTYVQFKGTVNVCLDKCQGVECSNGQVGYGRRRRRSVPDISADPNAIYKVTMVTFIKVDYSDDELLRKGPGNIIRADSELPPRRRNATPVLATNGLADSADGVDASGASGPGQRLQLAGEHVREELAYTVVQERGVSGAPAARSASLVLAAVLAILAVVARWSLAGTFDFSSLLEYEILALIEMMLIFTSSRREIKCQCPSTQILIPSFICDKCRIVSFNSRKILRN